MTYKSMVGERFWEEVGRIRAKPTEFEMWDKVELSDKVLYPEFINLATVACYFDAEDVYTSILNIDNTRARTIVSSDGSSPLSIFRRKGNKRMVNETVKDLIKYAVKQKISEQAIEPDALVEITR